jgi:uncharacterized protein YndB with AHSA1/START domain
MGEVSVTRRFEAAPEAVFDAWLDPAKARRFFFATPDGEMVVCEIDPGPGGRFTLTDRRPEHGDIAHIGRFEALERPRRIVFTYAVPAYDPAITRVRIAIEPDGDGARLTLTNEDVDDEYAEQTRRGWTLILDRLAAALG